MSFITKNKQGNKISFQDANIIINRANLQQIFIKNQLLLVYTPILMAFYLQNQYAPNITKQIFSDIICQCSTHNWYSQKKYFRTSKFWVDTWWH